MVPNITFHAYSDTECTKEVDAAYAHNWPAIATMFSQYGNAHSFALRLSDDHGRPLAAVFLKSLGSANPHQLCFMRDLCMMLNDPKTELSALCVYLMKYAGKSSNLKSSFKHAYQGIFKNAMDFGYYYAGLRGIFSESASQDVLVCFDFEAYGKKILARMNVVPRPDGLLYVFDTLSVNDPLPQTQSAPLQQAVY